MSEITYPAKGLTPNPNLNSQQFGILNTLKEGDVVSFRTWGKKTWGKKHSVIQIDRHEHHVNIHSVPLNDTRKIEGQDARYVTNEHSWAGRSYKGEPVVHSFYPHNTEGTMNHEIKRG